LFILGSDSVKKFHYTVKMVNTSSKLRHDKVTADFRQAGISAINSKGIDRVSVSLICEIAKSTRPTFYSYFGNVDGLLADIWVSDCQDFFRRLADPNYNLLASKLAANDRALVEIMAISHRNPEVAEVVNRTVQNWWQDFAGNDEFKNLKFAWVIGARLGLLMMIAVDPTVKTMVIADQLLNSIEKLAPIKNKLTTDLLPAISDPQAKLESVEQMLLAATVNVIANSGISAASMARISRFAQVTTGSVYPRFPNISALILESFEFAAKHVVNQNLANTRDGSFGPDEFGLFVIAGLLPRRKQWRNYRLEAHIEGRVNKPLAKRIQQSNKEVNEQVSQALRKYQISEQVLVSASHLIHSIGIGFSLLYNAGIALNELDHRRITRQIVAIFEKTAQKPS
jgi:AcrR family transcriptional regulator